MLSCPGVPSVCAQVRQLQALGVRLRKDIMAEVDTAAKLYRCGLCLCVGRGV